MKNQKYSKTWGSSTWTFIIIAILIYLSISSDIRADEEKLVNQEIGKTVLVTRENFQEINIQLQNDNPSINSLKIEFEANQNELEVLRESLQNNTELGHVSWHSGQTTWEVLQEIEAKLIENNKNYRDYPNDYMHLLLSIHAYRDSQAEYRIVLDDLTLDNNTKKHLEDWYVVNAHNNVGESGYYGVIYRNDKTHQIVLANRGTEGGAMGVITDMLRWHSDWNTNLKETLVGQIVIGQQARNYQATSEAIKIAKETGYRLSFTGHSLGAWLAELSAFYSHAYFNFRNIKAVTFDSPGALPMMEKLQSNIKNKDTQVNIENIEVVTYLAAPNPVNSCNSHVGKVYRVAPQMEWANWVNNTIPSFIKTTMGDKIQGLLAAEGHMLMGILEIFDPITGKPKEYRRMADWPRMQYNGTPKDFSDQKAVILEDIMSGMGMPWVNVKIGVMGVKAFDYIVGDATLMTMIDFLLNLATIDQEQYWAYFECMTMDTAGEETSESRSRKNKTFNKQFSLIAKAKYREGRDNAIMNLAKGSVDDYLYELYESKGKLEHYEDMVLIRTQMKELLSFFSIEPTGHEYSLIPNKGYDVEIIRQRAKRLLQVLPKNVQKLWQNPVISETCEVTLQLLDDLPLEVAHYIEIHNKESELRKKLSKEQVVLISGAGGMGKSTLATKYGKDRKQEGAQVRWIKGTQIEEEFLQLAKSLGIETQNQKPEIIRDLVYGRFDNLSKKQPILLIFDNVKEKGKIEEYLKNLPNHVKVIITTRDKDLLIGKVSIDLQGFNVEEAMSYLKRALGNREFKKLIEVVGTSPFRLSKVVVYLQNNCLMSIEDFIIEYEEIKRGRKQNEEIYPEVELLFNDLKKESPESWGLLKYLAYLDAEGVSSELISNIMGVSGKKLQEYVNELKKSSLMDVIIKQDKIIFKINHQIIQDETKIASQNEDGTQISKILEKLVSELDKVFPDVNQDPQNWEKAIELVNHVIMLIQNIYKMELSIIEISNLLLKIGFYYFYVDCDYKKAVYCWEELLKSLILANKDTIAIVTSLNNLGRAYEKLGGEENIRKGLRYMEESLKMNQALFSGNHPSIATSLNNVGCAYQSLGGEESIRKGLQYKEESLKMDQALFSGNHPRTAASLNNVGMAYYALGGEENIRRGLKYKEASLKMNQALFSGNHPRIAGSLNNIGLAYQSLGGEENIRKGLQYKEESLKMNQALFSGNHPDIATSLNNIGMAYVALGGEENIRKGLQYKEESLKIRQALFSGNHPDIAVSLNNVGTAYYALGDISKCLEYLKQAYSICDAILNKGDKRTKTIKSLIETLEPNFFIEQGLRGILQEYDCLGGNKVGFECRWTIASRGVTNDHLIKIKQKIQKDILNNIVEAVNDYGWSNVGIVFGDWGVKRYTERDYIKKTLEELNNAENIEIAQMLCFESTNLGIMKSKKKPYSVVEDFTRNNPELVKKIAREHPEFFVDGQIVEACVRAMPGDHSFEAHIFKHIKYMGMEERKEKLLKIVSGF